jgi:hypothetical protein
MSAIAFGGLPTNVWPLPVPENDQFAASDDN